MTIKQCLLISFLALILWVALLFAYPAFAVAPIINDVEFITLELKAICAAESTGDWTKEPIHWNPDGTVLRGRVNPKDIGQCQINETIWGENAKALGFDIHDFNGNRKMANWIYETRGNRDWYLSKAGWNKGYLP